MNHTQGDLKPLYIQGGTVKQGLWGKVLCSICCDELPGPKEVLVDQLFRVAVSHILPQSQWMKMCGRKFHAGL